MISAEAAQPISLVLHELATNATKYGALSANTGVVRLDWQIDQARTSLRLRWVEEGGPRVAEPQGEGFGTKMIQATVEVQLGGTVEREWTEQGLGLSLSVPLANILGSDGDTRGSQEKADFRLDFRQARSKHTTGTR
jgi:two-component sensor histidine kinase